MTTYLVHLEVRNLDSSKKARLQHEFLSSTPTETISDWLSDHKLPRLSSWAYDGQSGSNAPGPYKGILNTLFMRKRNQERHLEKEFLIITIHELVPVDPTTVL